MSYVEIIEDTNVTTGASPSDIVVVLDDQVTVIQTPEQGPPGPPGPQGPKGDTGDRGPQGPQGITGATGSTIYLGDVAPPTPIPGNMWWDSDSGNTYIFYVDPSGSGQWVQQNTVFDATVSEEAIDDRVAALLVPGDNITLAYDDVANALTISSTGGGGSGGGIPEAPTDGQSYARRGSDASWQISTAGAVGPAGPEGPQGPAGPPGPQGVPGMDSTVPGPQGPAGPKGDTGDTGPQGTPGTQGPAGPKGDTGDTGAQGPAGQTGAQGVPGPAGADGAPGPPGPEGPQGPAGAAGTGINVRGQVPTEADLPMTGNTQGDAYVVTETGDLWSWDEPTAAWINLGPVQGPPGPQGIPGPPGSQGPKGDTGAQGPPGVEGAQGVQGVPGPKGDTGDIGPPGPQGDTGAAGAEGPQGPPGEAGAQGPPGAAGADSTVPGPPGADSTVPGPQGPQGDPGPPGADGAQGPAGPPGADSTVPGPQGPQGPPGPAPDTSQFVLKAGDTITGSLTVNNGIYSTNGAVYLGAANYIYHDTAQWNMVGTGPLVLQSLHPTTGNALTTHGDASFTRTLMGAPEQGSIYLGSAGVGNIYWDGVKFQFLGGDVFAPRLMTTGTGPGTGTVYFGTWGGPCLNFYGGVWDLTIGYPFKAADGVMCRSGRGSIQIYGAQTFNSFYDGSSNVRCIIDDTFMGYFAWAASDYRIKKDVADLPSMWETAKKLRPIKYTHKDFTPEVELERTKDIGPFVRADDIERWGFIAHELQETLIESAASSHKDAPDAIQSPNLSTVVAALTKALQEAMARIEALEAKVTHAV